MIRPTIATLLIASALPALCAAQAPAPPQPAGSAPVTPIAPQPLAECEVIARANSEVILACDLDWQVELMLQQRIGKEAAASGDPMIAAAKRQLLQQMALGQLEMALLYGDFRSNAPNADVAGIHRSLEPAFESREVPRLLKMVGVKDRDTLEARLREVGTSLEERRQDFYRTMIARSWVNQAIEYDKEVTHEQMLDYYHDHLKDYEKPERARWEELMISFSKHPTKADAYRVLAGLGNKAHTAAAAAAPDKAAFGELARAVSDGFNADEEGVYDWTSRGALAAAAIDKALFTLPPGQMSPILEGPTGFHIVRVLERQQAGPTPFREVQADIRRGLNNERFGAAVTAKLEKLKRDARLWTVFTGDLTAERLAQLQNSGPQRR